MKVKTTEELLTWYKGQATQLMDRNRILRERHQVSKDVCGREYVGRRAICVSRPTGTVFEKCGDGSYRAYVQYGWGPYEEGTYFWCIEVTAQDLETGRAHRRLVELIEYAADHPESGTWVEHGGDLPNDYQLSK